MSIGRPKHQPIALADILVDQDRFVSNSDSEVTNLSRIHIRIDMPDSRYLSAHHPEALPSTCSGGAQSTTAYQDMTPFTAVSWLRSAVPFRYQSRALLNGNSQSEQID